MNVTIIDNTYFPFSKQEIVSFDPIDDTIESVLKKFDLSINLDNVRVACGDQKFYDFKIPISTCLFYGGSISIVNCLLNLTIVPNLKNLAPIEIEVDAKDSISELFKQVRLKFRVKNFQLSFNGRNLNELTAIDKHFRLKNNSKIDLLIDPSESDTVNQFFKISVTQSGKEIELSVAAFETVNELKQKIQNSQGLPIDQQRLFYAGRHLEDNKTLSDYRISNNSILQLIVRLRDGYRFADVDDQIPKKYEWNKSAPDWRIAKAGLCLEGQCSNRSCKANSNMVIMNMGVPIIYQVGMPNNVRTECPLCHSYVKPTTCAFNNCKWRFKGVKETSEGPKKVSCEWKNIGDHYSRFDDNEESLCEWNSLVIETSRIDSSNGNGCLTNSDICAICLDDISSKECLLKCKHFFHEKCFNEYKRYAANPTCPLCRAVC